MANNFKNIDYSRQLFESLRSYFSLNSNSDISILYKILICFLQPLQPAFDAYDIFRVKEALIAQCEWQIGQLTNVLNSLYDTLLARIFITQSEVTVISDPKFEYDADHWDRTFAEDETVFERPFNDRASTSLVTINVPQGVDLADLIATVEQIRLKGIAYNIQFI